MKIAILKLVTVFICISAAQKGWSESLLENQERLTAQSISNANLVSQYYSKYRSVRNEYYYGPEGLQKQSELYLKNMQEWVQNGFKLLAYLNLDGSDEVNVSAIEQKASAMLSDQVRALSNIQTLGSQIERQASTALKLLGGTESFDASIIPSSKDILESALQAHQQLKYSIEELSKIPGKSSVKLRAAMGLTSQGSMAKLKLRLIERGLKSLLPAIAEVENLLAAQEKLEPIFAEIAAMEELANQSLVFTRPFHLKAIASKAINNCQAAQLKIQEVKNSVNSDFIQSYTSRLKLYCENIESYQTQLSVISTDKSKLILNYFKSLVPAAKRKCNLSPSPAYCEKFAILAGIPSDTYSSFTASRLEFIESELMSIQPLLK